MEECREDGFGLGRRGGVEAWGWSWRLKLRGIGGWNIFLDTVEFEILHFYYLYVVVFVQSPSIWEIKVFYLLQGILCEKIRIVKLK